MVDAKLRLRSSFICNLGDWNGCNCGISMLFHSTHMMHPLVASLAEELITLQAPYIRCFHLTLTASLQLCLRWTWKIAQIACQRAPRFWKDSLNGFWVWTLGSPSPFTHRSLGPPFHWRYGGWNRLDVWWGLHGQDLLGSSSFNLGSRSTAWTRSRVAWSFKKFASLRLRDMHLPVCTFQAQAMIADQHQGHFEWVQRAPCTNIFFWTCH